MTEKKGVKIVTIGGGSSYTPELMQGEIAGRLPVMRQLSEQLYSVWISGLRR